MRICACKWTLIPTNFTQWLHVVQTQWLGFGIWGSPKAAWFSSRSLVTGPAASPTTNFMTSCCWPEALPRLRTCTEHSQSAVFPNKVTWSKPSTWAWTWQRGASSLSRWWAPLNQTNSCWDLSWKTQCKPLNGVRKMRGSLRQRGITGHLW